MTFSYRFTKLVMSCLFWTTFRWRIHNRERVPKTGPVILASNHASYLDPPLIGAAVEREIHFLARDTLFRFPLFGRYLRSINTVPVDRDGKSPAGLRSVMNLLDQDQAVLLFPEGTRSSDGDLVAAKNGVGFVIASINVPVVPLRVFGTFKAYNRTAVFPRPYQVQVKFGMPVDFSAARKRARECSRVERREVYQQIADEVMGQIAELAPHTDVYRFG